ncbi:hypothetical protein ACWEQI_25210, partial [Streptomyces coelicoflavus]
MEGLTFPSRFLGGPMKPQAAVAKIPPRRHGELSAASINHISKLAFDVWEDASTVTRHQRTQATRGTLQYLSTHPGRTWQERWDASPLGKGLIKANSLGARRMSCPEFRRVRGSCFRRTVGWLPVVATSRVRTR